jgi:amidase
VPLPLPADPGVSEHDVVEPLAAELASMAQWLDLDQVVVAADGALGRALTQRSNTDQLMEAPMNEADELAYRSATEIASAIRTKEVSPVEVLEATITRVEQRNPSLNALVFTAFDEARERARAAEQAVLSGDELGPLHGVPTAIKDLFDFKPGWPATFGGIPALRDQSLPISCVWAERMEAAGAIIVGKTNSPVMGFRGTCDNPLFGPTSNPFDLSRNSGGSSGAELPLSLTGCSVSRRVRTAADRSVSQPRGVASWASSSHGDGFPW